MAVGPGVEHDVVGARVVSTTGGTGGYTELVCVPADGLIPVPSELELAEAAALLADGRTAVGLLDLAALEPGATVLVEAAAGGVGSLLVQFAKRAGAFVIAAVGEESKLDVARSLGADVVVNYGRRPWLRGTRAGPSEMNSLTARALAGTAAGAIHPVIGQRVRWCAPLRPIERSRIAPLSARRC